MATFARTLSLQRTPLSQHAHGYTVLPVCRHQARTIRTGALSDVDVAGTVATSAQLQTGADGVDAGVYIGLGLLLAGFIGTFGVAPMFRSSFKEEETWIEIHEQLTSMGGVPSTEPEEAARKAKSEAVLMDVRIAHKFDANACPDSQNFPLYQPISGMSLSQNIRRAAFTFFGVFGTERNAQWLQQVEEAVPKDKEIVLVCDHGGSLEPTNGTPTGFQSQSLKAAYFLRKAGYSKISYMKGGLAEYQRLVADLVPGDKAFAY